jgi:hypothetical protein
VGVNVTVAVQLALAARVAVQVVVSVKTVPVMVSGKVMLSAAVPVLVMVTLRALEEPEETLPNARDDALTLTTGAGVTPVPVSVIFWGEPEALSAIERVPL